MPLNHIKIKSNQANKPTAIPTFGLRVKSILEDIPLIELSDIAEYQEPENPVWTIDQPVIRLDLRVGIKKEINPTNFIQLFNNFKCTYENYQFINTLMVQKLRMLLDVLP